MPKAPSVRIVHFNDVYHVTNELLISRFASVLHAPHTLQDRNPQSEEDIPTLRIFSGDVFSPSLEAAVLRGEHMTDLLNALDIDVACYGNHDFDFGEDRLSYLSKLTNFPWLLTNAHKDGILLADAKPFVVKEVAGYRFGFFGLAGTDWPSNCQHLPDCEISNPSLCARSTARQLRIQENCDFVIAVTHMRYEEDLTIFSGPEYGPERVDLILGGHDHNVLVYPSDNCGSDTGRDDHDQTRQPYTTTDYPGSLRLVKSGTDWRSLSILDLHIEPKSSQQDAAKIVQQRLFQIHDLESHPNYHDIQGHSTIPPILAAVQEHVAHLVTKPLFRTAVALEGRSTIIRSRETNLGNMLADIVRAFYDCDIALVNSGSIRCDKVLGPTTNSRHLSIRDAIDILPFDNAFVLRSVSGSKLLQALENAVSDDHSDGRFLQVSGMRFAFSWRLPNKQRITRTSIINDSGMETPILPDACYKTAMVDFIATGFDGYSCFKDTAAIVDAEGAVTDTKLLMEILSSDDDKSVASDQTAASIERARNIIISRYHEDGLPEVEPQCDDRIHIEEH